MDVFHYKSDPPKDLTPRQSEVFSFIVQYLEKTQRPPTRNEIRIHFGWSSPNAAEDHIKALRKKGYIKTRPGLARAIEVV